MNDNSNQYNPFAGSTVKSGDLNKTVTDDTGKASSDDSGKVSADSSGKVNTGDGSITPIDQTIASTASDQNDQESTQAGKTKATQVIDDQYLGNTQAFNPVKDVPVSSDASNPSKPNNIQGDIKGDIKGGIADHMNSFVKSNEVPLVAETTVNDDSKLDQDVNVLDLNKSEEPLLSTSKISPGQDSSLGESLPTTTGEANATAESTTTFPTATPTIHSIAQSDSVLNLNLDSSSSNVIDQKDSLPPLPDLNTSQTSGVFASTDTGVSQPGQTQIGTINTSAVQPIQPAQSAQTVESIQQPVKPAQVAELTQTGQSAQTVEPVKSVLPAQTAQSVQSPAQVIEDKPKTQSKVILWLIVVLVISVVALLLGIIAAINAGV